MIFLLSVAVLALFVMLRDTMQQVKRLERQVAALGRPGPTAEPLPFAAEPSASDDDVSEAEGVALLPSGLDPRWHDQADEPESEAFEPDTLEPEPSAKAPPSPAAPPPPRRPVVRIGFEELFGRKLPIWAGGITLGVAGILLVKYSIDQGLLSPVVRVALGLAFGLGLVAAAELALRQEHRVRDPRVAQALAGAGVTSLFASIVAAANLYALIGPVTAFVGLAAVTALAMALALRFGAPSALLGLVGGLAAPALVNSGEPDIPLLSVYLALTVAGLAGLSLRQRWAWLGLGAMLGGAGWSLVLIVSGALDTASTLSVGLIVVAFGTAVPMLAYAGPRTAALRAVAGVVAAAQMALLVSRGGFDLLSWGLFGLLSLALLWLIGRVRALRPVAALGLALALVLAAMWPDPPLARFAMVIAVLLVLYGGGGWLRLWRVDSGPLEAAQLAAAALGSLVVGLFHFRLDDGTRDPGFALLALLAAALVAAAAATGWRNPLRRGDSRLAILAAATTVLLGCAAALGLPEWLLPVALAVLAGGLLQFGRIAGDRRIEPPALAMLAAATLALGPTAHGPIEVGRTLGFGGGGEIAQALVRWLAVALAATLFAWRLPQAPARAPIQVGAALLGYGLLAQAVPPAWLGLACALALAASGEVLRQRGGRWLLPTLATFAALFALWGVAPLTVWSGAAVPSLFGLPVLLPALPNWEDALRLLVLPALVAALTLVRSRPLLAGRERVAAASSLAVLMVPGLHILYKQAFALVDTARFVRLGLAERTVWEGLILAAAFVAWRRAKAAWLAPALTLIALAHLLVYTLLLHDPLWAEQAVGTVPLANWLLPAAAVGFAGLWLLGRTLPRSPWQVRLVAAARMALVLWFAVASLRQVSVGSRFAGVPVSAGESIGWSVAAIAVALGFLMWGIKARSRIWRIGSLVLMLVAVAKVFLVDASGLQGLLRIASFLALGFSLIGLGWLYSRFLRSDPAPEQAGSGEPAPSQPAAARPAPA